MSEQSLRKFQIRSATKKFRRILLLAYLGVVFCSLSLHANDRLVGIEAHPKAALENISVQPNKETFVYSLSISEFANSFIQIPTSNVSGDSTTISSSYLAGRAAIYDVNNNKVGTCSASFLNMQNADGIYTDISNYITVNNGLVVSWFTPTTLINLELDSIINSMVTECMVTASTAIGVNPFYGQTFNLIVSSSGGRIYFEFTRTGTVF